MSSQDNRQQGRPWSEIDMESPGVQDDLGRWSQFGDQGVGEAGDEWATADDLVNTIVGAGIPRQQGQPRQQWQGQQQYPQPQQQGQSPRQPMPQQAQAQWQGQQAQAQWQEQQVQPEPESEPEPEPHSSGSFPRQQGMSEYGSWEAAGRGGSFDQYPQDEEGDDEVAEGYAHRRHDRSREDDRRPSHFEPGDRAGRKGRFTSVIALLLALLTVLVAVSPLLLTTVNQERWIVCLVASLPVTTVVALPATLLGLRSASKPKGQLGRGRGILSVIMCSVALVASSVIVVTNVAGMLNGLNEAGLVAKEQTSSDTMSIVFPGGKVELSNKAIKVLMKAGVLPDNTLDQGSIPISSQGGKIYVGSREIDTELVSQMSGGTQEASEETLKMMVEGMTSLQQHGFRVTTDGTTLTISNNRGQTVVTFDELITTSKGTSDAAKEAQEKAKAEAGAEAQSQSQSQVSGNQADASANDGTAATVASPDAAASQRMPAQAPSQT